MRGDSLRDLYAKTLAVLGLGLLAGAGAIVDYWPVGSSAPSITAATLRRPEIPVLAQQLDRSIPAPIAGRARAVEIRGTIHARNVGSARFLAQAPPNGEPVRTESIAAASRPLPVLRAPVDSEWTVTLPSSSLVMVVDQEMAPPINAAPSPGLIGGALRKTKDSIVRASAVTGSTIADALKGVGGAFKKVSPF